MVTGSRSRAAVVSTRSPSPTRRGEPWMRTGPTRSSSCMRSRATPMSSVRRAPPILRRAGGTGSSGRGHPSTRTAFMSSARTCWGVAREPRARGARRRAPPLRIPVPAHHHPRPGRRRGRARRPARDRAVGRCRRRLHGRHARPGVVRRRSRAGGPGGRPLRRGGGLGRSDRAVLSADRAIRSDPAFHGRRLLRDAGRPVDGLSIARGIGHFSYRTGTSSRNASATKPRARKSRSKAGATRSSPTCSTTARSWRSGSTRTPTSR